MAPEPARSRQWMHEGTQVFARALAAATDKDLRGPSLLPGWTGRHLLAHVAANADALRNLVNWARTGIETPMYASPQQRNTDIETGSRRPAPELRHWYTSAAATLDADLATLTDGQWHHRVRTAQGRTVPATEIPWMRAREVMVHAVDLGTGITFADLPDGFLTDLIDDVVAKRAATEGHPTLTVRVADTEHTWAIGDGRPDAHVSGPLPALTAYLTGRSDGSEMHTPYGSPVPTLPSWL